MKRLVASVALICAALAGCAHRGQTTASANDRYVGTQADDFFRQRGMASRSSPLSDGHTLYEWRSDGAANGESLTLTCVMQIEADRDGKIVSMRITRDTIGMWKTSRCAEVFH